MVFPLASWTSVEILLLSNRRDGSLPFLALESSPASSGPSFSAEAYRQQFTLPIWSRNSNHFCQSCWATPRIIGMLLG